MLFRHSLSIHHSLVFKNVKFRINNRVKNCTTNKNVFPDEIMLRDLVMQRGNRKYELLQDFKCCYKGEWITVQKGFITDGISIPKMFWGLIGPFSDAFSAALVHDWLFSPFNKKYNWKESNWIFYEIMKECCVNPIERRVIYAGVFIGSYPVWTKRFENYGLD